MAWLPVQRLWPRLSPGTEGMERRHRPAQLLGTAPRRRRPDRDRARARQRLPGDLRLAEQPLDGRVPAGHIGKIDAKTTEIKWWAVPTKNARARRLNIDDQDRLTFTEYRGNKVGVFDTRTEKFT